MTNSTPLHTSAAERLLVDEAFLSERLFDFISSLRLRLSDIEAMVFDRITDVSPQVTDVEYEVTLRRTVAAIIDYSLNCILDRGESADTIPPAVLLQARLAVHGGVAIETVLLRYIVGHREFNQFIIYEADRAGLPCRELATIQNSILHRLTDSVAREYKREEELHTQSSERKRAQLVKDLLINDWAGVDLSSLNYTFDSWHLAIIATGLGAATVLRGLAAQLRAQLLCISASNGALWAWLGSGEPIRSATLDPCEYSDTTVALAVGEPGLGIAGWRSSHGQAQAARRVALHRPCTITRCVDVLLEAAVLNAEPIRTLLGTAYLSPLDTLKVGGAELREMLRIYLGSRMNIAKTAQAMKKERKTIARRLRDIETALGHSISDRAAELEVALRLDCSTDVGEMAHSGSSNGTRRPSLALAHGFHPG